MLRFVLLIMCFAHSASAQFVSLSEMPSTYSYTSDTDSGPYTARFGGVENGMYRIDTYETKAKRGQDPYWSLWLNAFSQQVISGVNQSEVDRYVPHDCFGVIGECLYAIVWSDGVEDDVIVNSWFEGNILIKDVSILTHGEQQFWYFECAIEDQFGFPTDLFQYRFDGDEIWQRRTASSTGELSQTTPPKLRKFCLDLYNAKYRGAV